MLTEAHRRWIIKHGTMFNSIPFAGLHRLVFQIGAFYWSVDKEEYNKQFKTPVEDLLKETMDPNNGPSDITPTTKKGESK